MRAALEKARRIPSSTIHGIRNVIRWMPVIWNDCDWDWDFLAEFMERKLRYMSRDAKTWMVERCDVSSHQMLICAELLKRVRANDYYENADKRFDRHTQGKHWVAHIEAQRKQDWSLLGKMLVKYMACWWD